MSENGAYRAALRTYYEKRDQAADMFKFIKRVAESIDYRELSFLVHFFGVRAPADQAMNVRGDAEKHRYDMTKWPSHGDMMSTIREWSEAFDVVTTAWHQIPEPDRFGLTPPPKVMKSS